MRQAFDSALKTVDASRFNLPKEKGDHFLLLPKGELVVVSSVRRVIRLPEVEARIGTREIVCRLQFGQERVRVAAY